jgi:hypothetical protein
MLVVFITVLSFIVFCDYVASMLVQLAEDKTYCQWQNQIGNDLDRNDHELTIFRDKCKMCSGVLEANYVL